MKRRPSAFPRLRSQHLTKYFPNQGTLIEEYFRRLPVPYRTAVATKTTTVIYISFPAELEVITAACKFPLSSVQRS